ncbi:hypothetical protein [Nocardia farcinica]|uniref:hypothetical protein n=1 Tax=Nocardia farcinica TaxID=37329 RepID=UPI0024560988|nr:hypothetical protein [Nocardia farcinica]
MAKNIWGGVTFFDRLPTPAARAAHAPARAETFHDANQHGPVLMGVALVPALRLACLL